MAKSQFLDLLDGYEEPLGEGGAPLPLGKRFFVRNISGSTRRRSREGILSRIGKLLSFIARRVIYTKAKVFGLFALTFGFSALVLHLLCYYIGIFGEISRETLILGSLTCVLGIPLMFFDKPFTIMLQDTPVLDYIFFEFFCIQRVYRKEGEPSIHPAFAAVLGCVLSIASCFLSVREVLLAFGAILFMVVAFSSPEFSYIISLLLLPFIGLSADMAQMFVFILLFTAVSFLRKVYSGKRVIYFELYDAIIFVMMLLILISGIFIKGMESFTASAVLLVMSLGYYMTSNIITNRRLADRVMNTVVVSAFPVSLVSIVSYITESLTAGALVRPMQSSVFGTTDVCATFLLVALCMSLAHTAQSRALHKKIPYTASVVINFAALLLTGEVFAVTALLIGAISYLVFKLKKPAPAIIISLLLVLPHFLYFLPESTLSPLFDFIPSSEGFREATETLVASLQELVSSFFFGIGMGEESFTSQMQGYNIAATDSGNLFVELALEAGILSLIAFIWLIAVRIRHRMAYNQYVKGSVLRHSQPVVSAAIFSLLFFGIFNYIWSSEAMFYLFFVVFGIESAMLRVSRQSIDERVLYFVDARSSESAAIDVSLDEDF